MYGRLENVDAVNVKLKGLEVTIADAKVDPGPWIPSDTDKLIYTFVAVPNAIFPETVIAPPGCELFKYV